MIQIRDEQMAAFECAMHYRHLPELIETLVRRLDESGHLPAQEPAVEPDLLEEADAPDADDQTEEAPVEAPLSPEDLRALVRRQVRLARRAGIYSEDGLLQFLSYGFLLGHDWDQNPDVQTVLHRGLGEDGCLEALHALLG